MNYSRLKWIFLIVLLGWWLAYELKKTKNNFDPVAEAFKDAKLPPYKPSTVFHHNYVMALGRAVEPKVVLPSYMKYKEALLVPPRTQGQCASCWAFAVCDSIADRVSMHTRGKVREHLSPQELLSCFLPRWFPCTRGGIPELAFRYAIARGLSRESVYPYVNEIDTTIPACRFPKMGFLEWWRTPDPSRHEKFPERIFAEAGSIKSLCDEPISQEVINQNIQNMKAEIYQNGPIVGTVQVFDDLYNYDGESVYEVGKDAILMGGHAVEIFGWSDAGSNTEEAGFQGAYWHVRNSWLMWPKNLPYKHNGWFFVRMGNNTAGIESRASCASVMLTQAMKELAKTSSWSSTAYLSYNEYVADPERQNFFAHLQKRRRGSLM